MAAGICWTAGSFRATAKKRGSETPPFPSRPASINAVLLSHAHTSITLGNLPTLVKNGFSRDPIVASPATTDLCKYMLTDSASLAGKGCTVHGQAESAAGRAWETSTHPRSSNRFIRWKTLTGLCRCSNRCPVGSATRDWVWPYLPFLRSWSHARIHGHGAGRRGERPPTQSSLFRRRRPLQPADHQRSGAVATLRLPDRGVNLRRSPAQAARRPSATSWQMR